MSIRILIADDHALLRQGIKNVLELEEDFVIVAEAGDGEEAVKKAGEVLPDIALIDINMPRLNGLEVTKRVRDSFPTVKVIVLTIHDDESYVVEVVKAGAAGYLLKDVEPGMLIKAIRTVFDGESFIYPTLAKKLFGEITRLEGERRQGTANFLQHGREERLTLRELEVLQLIAKGLSNQEIAGQLFLSEKTVKNHLTNIFRKIDVNDRTQAVLYAIKNKIVVLD
ncbi:MAG: response regulator transcription factor [Negativicutes bacterium]|nr:response regulator transcription factor [Negativicutes bacterium]MDR3589751.1 response regulator transcription factor [Negativicutes bacterium]